eukprot:675163-Amphidinium_carterae.1
MSSLSNCKRRAFKISQERQKRLAAMKQKTRCSTCDKFGHWSGDKECPGKKGATAYFSVAEVPKGEPEAFVVRHGTWAESRFLGEPCEHCLQHDRCVQRGANARMRLLKCEACNMLIVQ